MGPQVDELTKLDEINLSVPDFFTEELECFEVSHHSTSNSLVDASNRETKGERAAAEDDNPSSTKRRYTSDEMPLATKRQKCTIAVVESSSANSQQDSEDEYSVSSEAATTQPTDVATSGTSLKRSAWMDSLLNINHVHPAENHDSVETAQHTEELSIMNALFAQGDGFSDSASDWYLGRDSTDKRSLQTCVTHKHSTNLSSIDYGIESTLITQEPRLDSVLVTPPAPRKEEYLLLEKPLFVSRGGKLDAGVSLREQKKNGTTWQLMSPADILPQKDRRPQKNVRASWMRPLPAPKIRLAYVCSQRQSSTNFHKNSR